MNSTQVLSFFTDLQNAQTEHCCSHTSQSLSQRELSEAIFESKEPEAQRTGRHSPTLGESQQQSWAGTQHFMILLLFDFCHKRLLVLSPTPTIALLLLILVKDRSDLTASVMLDMH